MENAIAMRDSDPNQNLIKLTLREETLKKIAYMKNNNLTVAQLNEAKSYCETFTYRCSILYGLSKEQLREFTDEQLIELGKVLWEGDSKIVVRENILFALIPILGWLVWLTVKLDSGGTQAKKQFDLYRKIKIDKNKNFFPIKQLREILNTK